jgi:hypothetical protein
LSGKKILNNGILFEFSDNKENKNKKIFFKEVEHLKISYSFEEKKKELNRLFFEEEIDKKYFPKIFFTLFRFVFYVFVLDYLIFKNALRNLILRSYLYFFGKEKIVLSNIKFDDVGGL